MTKSESQSVETDKHSLTIITEPPPSNHSRLLMRFLVGTAIEGTSQFLQRLAVWNETARQVVKEAPDVSVKLTPEQLEVLSRPPVAETETEAERLRYALVGLAFKAEDRARRRLSFLKPLGRSAGRITAKALRPAANSRLGQGAQQRFDMLVARGESHVAEWIKLGRVEEKQSRIVAQQALGTSIDEVIDHLAENPEVRGLIQQQSVGMAEQIVEEVRVRVVTADALIERIVRAILRRKPREALPEPPEMVKAGAKPLLQLTSEDNNNGA